jgi:hypothetical protein
MGDAAVMQDVFDRAGNAGHEIEVRRGATPPLIARASNAPESACVSVSMC